MRRRCSRDALGGCGRAGLGVRYGPRGFCPRPRRGFPRCAASGSSAFLRFRSGAVAAARSSGSSPVRLPPFRAARSPGSWFGGPPSAVLLPGWVFRLSVPALMRPLVPGSPLTRSRSSQVPWPVRQLKSPRSRGLSIFQKFRELYGFILNSVYFLCTNS